MILNERELRDSNQQWRPIQENRLFSEWGHFSPPPVNSNFNLVQLDCRRRLLKPSLASPVAETLVCCPGSFLHTNLFYSITKYETYTFCIKICHFCWSIRHSFVEFRLHLCLRDDEWLGNVNLLYEELDIILNSPITIAHLGDLQKFEKFPILKHME